MKISLTFTDATPGDLRRLADAIEGIGAAPAMQMPVQGAGAIPMPTNPGNGSEENEDDETGGTVGNSGEADSAGVYYDERIHSDPPTKTAKGVWRKKRGVDKDLIAQVEAEQRNKPQQQPTMQMPQQQPTQAQQPVMQMPQQQPVMQMPQQQPTMQMPQQQPTQAQQPVMQMPQTAAPAQMPQQQGGVVDFAGFMSAITSKMQQRDNTGAPLISMEYLTRISNEIGQAFQKQVSSITDIANDPNMIAYAVQLLVRDQRW